MNNHFSTYFQAKTNVNSKFSDSIFTGFLDTTIKIKSTFTDQTFNGLTVLQNTTANSSYLRCVFLQCNDGSILANNINLDIDSCEFRETTDSSGISILDVGGQLSVYNSIFSTGSSPTTNQKGFAIQFNTNSLENNNINLTSVTFEGLAAPNIINVVKSTSLTMKYVKFDQCTNAASPMIFGAITTTVLDWIKINNIVFSGNDTNYINFSSTINISNVLINIATPGDFPTHLFFSNAIVEFLSDNLTVNLGAKLSDNYVGPLISLASKFKITKVALNLSLSKAINFVTNGTNSSNTFADQGFVFIDGTIKPFDIENIIYQPISTLNQYGGIPEVPDVGGTGAYGGIPIVPTEAPTQTSSISESISISSSSGSSSNLTPDSNSSSASNSGSSLSSLEIGLIVTVVVIVFLALVSGAVFFLVFMRHRTFNEAYDPTEGPAFP